MAAQMDHLILVSARSNVDLEVIPLTAHIPTPPLNMFVVYDERLVIFESETGATTLRDPRDIEEHLELFEYFRRNTLKGDDCRTFLHKVAEDFRSSSSREGQDRSR